jgi:hypothetical protein
VQIPAQLRHGTKRYGPRGKGSLHRNAKVPELDGADCKVHQRSNIVVEQDRVTWGGALDAALELSQQKQRCAQDGKGKVQREWRVRHGGNPNALRLDKLAVDRHVLFLGHVTVSTVVSSPGVP